METNLANKVCLPKLSRRKKKKKTKWKLYFCEVPEWKISYTSSTTKEVPWKMLRVLLNVHQFAYQHFAVFKIPSIKENCTRGLQTDELEVDVCTGQAAVTLVPGKEK
jgi:hypothetical protein